MYAEIDTEISGEIQDALEDYASGGRISGHTLPFSHPAFDHALDRIRWRIARTLGQSEARFHADLRDLATRDLNGDDSLRYVLVSGTAARVALCLGTTQAPDLVRDRNDAPGAGLRFARYSLDATTLAGLTPGQIGRIGQQFYDPLCRFGTYQSIALPPSRGSGDLRILVACRHDRRATIEAALQPPQDRLGGRSRGYPLYPEGALEIEVHATWSDTALAVAVAQVRTALMDASPELQWDLAQGRARFVGMTRPDGDGVEITAIGTTQESEAILVPMGLIAHNRYRFDQALLDFAPLKMDGQTVC